MLCIVEKIVTALQVGTLTQTVFRPLFPKFKGHQDSSFSPIPLGPFLPPIIYVLLPSINQRGVGSTLIGSPSLRHCLEECYFEKKDKP